MSEYPFNLRGRQENFKGTGYKDGETEQSREFILEQGVVIAKIEHHGSGDLQLSFIHVEANAEAKHGVIKKMNRTAARLGDWVTGGKLRTEGTEEYEDYLMGIWKLGAKGECSSFVIKQVKEGCIDSLRPGKYCLEVTSKNKWSCRLIQPDVGQSLDTLEDESIDQDNIDAGTYLLGPVKSGSRPVLAHVRHSGRGEFYAAAYSVDGTHQCLIFYQKGQLLVESQPTEIRPGKEYFLYIEADGEWNISFTKGH